MLTEPQLSELAQLLLSGGAYENAFRQWTEHCAKNPSATCDAMNIDIVEDFRSYHKHLALAIARQALIQRVPTEYRRMKRFIATDCVVNCELIKIFGKMAEKYKQRVDLKQHPSAVQVFNDYVHPNEPQDSHMTTQAGHNDDKHARQREIEVAMQLMHDDFVSTLSNYDVLNEDVILALTSRHIYNVDQFLNMGLQVLHTIHRKRDEVMSTVDWMHRYKLMTLADEKILLGVLHLCGIGDGAGDAEAGSPYIGKRAQLQGNMQKARLGAVLSRPSNAAGTAIRPLSSTMSTRNQASLLNPF